MGRTQTYTIQPHIIRATTLLYGQTLKATDWIGVYVGNELRAKSAVNPDGNGCLLTVNVAQNGEEVRFKLWHDNMEYGIPVTVPIQSGRVSTITLDFTDFIEQSYELKSGWTLIGLPFIPENDAPEPLFDPILSRLNRITDNLQTYLPDEQLSTLTQMKGGLGYFVKMDLNTSYTLRGYAINLSTYSINLKPGWNLIGHPGLEKASITESIQQAIDANVIDRITDNLGTFFPNDQWSTLKEFTHGKGYFIKAKQGYELTFSPDAKPISQRRHALTKSTLTPDPWGEVVTIPNIPHLVRATITLNGGPIISGTMGAFSGNELRGKTVIFSETSTCLLTVNVSGVNEQISFRYWDGMREHKATSTLTAASDGESSISLSFTYTPESVAPPIFQPATTHYSTDSLRVELSSEIPDAVITYATNASMQDAVCYTEPFYITGTQTIYAQAASFGISSVITSATYTYKEKQPAVDPNLPKAEVAVGSDVPLNKEDFGVESLTSKTKPSATYEMPFQTEKTKKLLVKMTPNGNAFEVKGSVKLTNTKAFNALKKDKFTLDILLADSVLQQVQKDSVVVTVAVDCGKKTVSDSKIIVALVPARLDSVIIVSTNGTDSAKIIQYAIVVGSGFGTKPKGQIEYKLGGKIKRLSVSLQKETNYPAEVKLAISDFTVGRFFPETFEITVLKLSKKYNMINGRRDIVIDNKNGLSAKTLRD